MSPSNTHFPPYIPDAETAGANWDTPLTPAELALATDIFKSLRQMAQFVDPETNDACTYRLHFDIEGEYPQDARFVISYRAQEPSSGYTELGIGPDLGTAWSRLSDNAATNGSRSLPDGE